MEGRVALRYETEWVELVNSGWNRLLPPVDPGMIFAGIRDSIGRKGLQVELYGDGNAARRILCALRNISFASISRASA